MVTNIYTLTASAASSAAVMASQMRIYSDTSRLGFEKMGEYARYEVQ